MQISALKDRTSNWFCLEQKDADVNCNQQEFMLGLIREYVFPKRYYCV